MGVPVTHRLIILSLLLILGMPVARAQEYCAPVVIKQLSQLGVGSERVEEIIYGNVIGSEYEDITEIEAWVRLRTCNGHLVVELTPDCRVIQTYAPKECRVQGVHHSW